MQAKDLKHTFEIFLVGDLPLTDKDHVSYNMRFGVYPTSKRDVLTCQGKK